MVGLVNALFGAKENVRLVHYRMLTYRSLLFINRSSVSVDLPEADVLVEARSSDDNNSSSPRSRRVGPDLSSVDIARVRKLTDKVGTVIVCVFQAVVIVGTFSSQVPYFR